MERIETFAKPGASNVVATIESVTSRLAEAGFVAAREEAEEIVACAAGLDVALELLLERRLRGEPLAWIVGSTTFCGFRVRVDPGVYVPRWQSEPLVHRALARLPDRGTAIDLCTGSGCIAIALTSQRPGARVIASELDERAVACATSNGVEVFSGDLFAPLPREFEGFVDVVVGVVPYVPSESLAFLPRDTFTYESALAYDGGDDGTSVLRRVIRESPRFLRPGGALVLELGGDEASVLQSEFDRHGFDEVIVFSDDDGDVRGIEATLLS
jgi:release factor glutamine methyltransferase